jgi:hypothetical protein
MRHRRVTKPPSIDKEQSSRRQLHSQGHLPRRRRREQEWRHQSSVGTESRAPKLKTGKTSPVQGVTSRETHDKDFFLSCHVIHLESRGVIIGDVCNVPPVTLVWDFSAVRTFFIRDATTEVVIEDAPPQEGTYVASVTYAASYKVCERPLPPRGRM